MAKTEKAGAAASTAKKSAPRAKVELSENSKGGIIKRIILAAVKLASRNGFEGLKNNGKNGAKIADNDTAGRKTAANKVQPKVSPGGSLAPVLKSEQGDVYNQLLKLAKAAAADLEKKNYSSSVKALYDYVAEGHGGGGTRSFDTTGFADLASKL